MVTTRISTQSLWGRTRTLAERYPSILRSSGTTLCQKCSRYPVERVVVVRADHRRAIIPDRLLWVVCILLNQLALEALRIPDDYRPGPNLPLSDQLVADVRIFLYELLNRSYIIRSKDEQRAVRRVGQRSG